MICNGSVTELEISRWRFSPVWCSEKSIHFMMPESVLKWDQNIHMQFAAGYSGGSLRDNL